VSSVAQTRYETYVYRCFDAGGVLLYIGATGFPESRCREHARTKAWWPQVESVEIESFPDRPTALAAERSAIAAESPRYNRQRPYRVLPRITRRSDLEAFLSPEPTEAAS
jgi:hypothetical protein